MGGANRTDIDLIRNDKCYAFKRDNNFFELFWRPRRERGKITKNEDK